jgi:hypothetical protein
MRTASSSSSNGITTSTGPKISSWAMRVELSTSANERLHQKGWLSRRMVNGDAVYEFTDRGLQAVEAGALVNRAKAQVN